MDIVIGHSSFVIGKMTNREISLWTVPRADRSRLMTVGHR
jgi:hypothetical protein